MPRLRIIVAACLLALLLSVGATALLSSVQRLNGEVTLDRGVQPHRAVRRALPRPAPKRHQRTLAVAPREPAEAAVGGAQAAEPRVAYAPAPHYPIQALRDERQGLVSVRVQLDARGRVLQAQVQRSSGDGQLDQAALRAVRRWTFDMPPHARRDMVLPIQFHIDGTRR